jgi:hypothetical protein
LISNLLDPEGPSSGPTRLSQWLADNHERVGKRYASEVARHYKMDAEGAGSTLCRKHQNAV